MDQGSIDAIANGVSALAQETNNSNCRLDISCFAHRSPSNSVSEDSQPSQQQQCDKQDDVVLSWGQYNDLLAELDDLRALCRERSKTIEYKAKLIEYLEGEIKEAKKELQKKHSQIQDLNYLRSYHEGQLLAIRELEKTQEKHNG